MGKITLQQKYVEENEKLKQYKEDRKKVLLLELQGVISETKVYLISLELYDMGYRYDTI